MLKVYYTRLLEKSNGEEYYCPSVAVLGTVNGKSIRVVGGAIIGANHYDARTAMYSTIEYHFGDSALLVPGTRRFDSLTLADFGHRPFRAAVVTSHDFDAISPSHVPVTLGGES